ncbi:MAG: hypothetical protein HZC28_05830 [Spirochaetes bacterium]|nr:hypothetical protein [Spirochaetota bacterium]
MSSLLIAAPKKIRIGIIDFGANGTSANEAQAISDLFRNELVRCGAFDVLDRKNMDAVLKEQAFQQTGCTESSCAVQVGKLLNMQYMIYGKIVKVGDYFLQTEMIDIETTKIVKSSKARFADFTEIEKHLKIMASDLANTGEYDYEEISLRKNNAFGGVVRNGLITAGCAAITATGFILAAVYAGNGDSVYADYLTQSSTDSATRLGDEYSSLYNLADGFAYAAEAGAVLGTVFITWMIVDWMNFSHYNGLQMKYKVTVTPKPDTLAVSLSVRF